MEAAAQQDPFSASRSDRCEQRLELSIKVSKLRNYDLVGLSDPFAVVYVNNSASAAIPPHTKQQLELHQQHQRFGQHGLQHQRSNPKVIAQQISKEVSKVTASLPTLPTPLGRPKQPARKQPWERICDTEVVQNTLEATFSRRVPLTYYFERAQQIAIDVYDNDSRSSNLLAHDYLGGAEFSVSSLVRSSGQVLELKLRMPAHPTRECGYVTIMAEDKANRRNLLKMDVAVSLRKRPMFLIGPVVGPYLVISRRVPVNRINQNVRNATLTTTSPTLTSNQNGQPNTKWIQVLRTEQVGRRDRGGTGNGIGTGCVFCFDSIRDSYERISGGREDTELRISLSFQVRKKEKEIGHASTTLSEWRSRGGVELISSGTVLGRNPGTITLRNFTVKEEPQFMDYIMGGCEIGLVIGIDFTMSNGDSMLPDSLHFSNMYSSNEYECAISTVGNILAQYDTDKEFPGFGFGAKLPPGYERVSHCFSLTGHNNPVCTDIDGVLNAYRQTLYNVKLSGPTEFSELIGEAARYAELARQKYVQAYTILLILTDGVINDFDDTTRAIVKASHLPLSIVIIGVGEADFQAMEALDGDQIPLSSRRCRDIVQFVPFRKYRNRPDMLAAEVLAEIPRQVVEYFTMKGILPDPRHSGRTPKQRRNPIDPSQPPPQPFNNFPFAPPGSIPPGHPASPHGTPHSQPQMAPPSSSSPPILPHDVAPNPHPYAAPSMHSQSPGPHGFDPSASISPYMQVPGTAGMSISNGGSYQGYPPSPHSLPLPHHPHQLPHQQHQLPPGYQTQHQYPPHQLGGSFDPASDIIANPSSVVSNASYEQGAIASPGINAEADRNQGQIANGNRVKTEASVQDGRR